MEIYQADVAKIFQKLEYLLLWFQHSSNPVYRSAKNNLNIVNKKVKKSKDKDIL